MTDDEFAELCSEHSDLSFEVTAEGNLIVLAPTYSLMGFQNQRIGRQVDTWAERDGRGIACDSSTGYLLPNSARRSPDASWTLLSRVKALPEASRNRIWHLCPDFVIEIRSATDRTRMLRAEMEEWVEDGAQLGWLIDPETAWRLRAWVRSKPKSSFFELAASMTLSETMVRFWFGGRWVSRSVYSASQQMPRGWPTEARVRRPSGWRRATAAGVSAWRLRRAPVILKMAALRPLPLMSPRARSAAVGEEEDLVQIAADHLNGLVEGVEVGQLGVGVVELLDGTGGLEFVGETGFLARHGATSI